jgi:hypothetical protein
MSQAADSLEEIWPSPGGSGTTSQMNEPQPTSVGVAQETPPQFDRVADVLGPLERVVLAADQRLGAIQQLVTTHATEAEVEVERRVREAAVEQRSRIAQLRQDLTGRRSEVSARFDAIFELLDEVDRDLARRAGEPPVAPADTQPLAVPQSAPTAAAPSPAPPQAPPPAAAAPAEQGKEKGIRRWFRRSKR